MSPAAGHISVLQKITRKLFAADPYAVDSVIWKLHHFGTCTILFAGLMLTIVENYIDSKSITCVTESRYEKYVDGFCWLHGASHVAPMFQGKATGCFIDEPQIGHQPGERITSYYLWLPHLLLLVLLVTRLPHQLWERSLEKGLIKSIIENGSSQTVPEPMPDLTVKGCPPATSLFEGDNVPPAVIVTNFIGARPKFKKYQFSFALLETSYPFVVLLCLQILHSAFNQKYWRYGTRVTDFLLSDPTKLQHNPMCELFPTEVACDVKIGSSTGGLNALSVLCTLQNNMFNQRYFFLLWWWGILLLMVTLVGLSLRWARLHCPKLSLFILTRKYYTKGITTLDISSEDSFALETVLDSLQENPTKQSIVLEGIVQSLSNRPHEGSVPMESLV